MHLEEKNYYKDRQSLYNECKKCLYYHTTLTMTDGSTIDGIIENVESDRVIVLVGEDVMEQECESQFEHQRQQFSYGPPRRRFRRFRRRAFPFNNLLALALLQYPYIAPPYPYSYPPYYNY
ncbi:hypothetical protein JCM1393_20380 [Clostridium carnis]